MTKIEQDKKVVFQMVRLYCHKKHKTNENLCKECRQLVEYANTRLDYCKFGEEKTSCKKCPVHCYKPEMRNKMRNVMKYSGPRMIIYNPLAAFRHILGK